jgi:hypothetical protein
VKNLKDIMSALSEKEQKGSLDPKEIQAKIDVLKELLEMSSRQAGDNVIGGLKKVTVAAPDEEGLKQGLQKAEDMVEEMPEGMDEEMSEEMSSDEEDEEDEEEGY